MRQATTLNISLTPGLRAFITDHVAFGRFGSASEVVRAALRVLERSDAAQPRSRQPRDRVGRQ